MGKVRYNLRTRVAPEFGSNWNIESSENERSEDEDDDREFSDANR